MKSKFKNLAQRRRITNSADAAKAQASFLEALAHHRQGQLAQAQILYRKALKLQPTHCDALHLSGLIAAQLENYQHAVELFDKAIAIFPRNAAFFSNRGLALQELRRLDEALSSYDQAIKLEPGFVDSHYNRGIALKELKRSDEALASYDQAIKLKPDFAEAYSNRGILLHDLMRFDEALSSYDQAARYWPDSAVLHINRGHTLKELKRLDEALASYDQAVRLKPDIAEVHFNRGNTLKELNRLDEAIASFDRALAINPDYAEAYSNRGVALEHLGRHQAALQSYATAIALDPDNALAHSNLAMTYFNIGDMRSSIESCRKSLSIDPKMVETHSSLIFQLDLVAGPDTAALQLERKRWNEIHAEPMMKTREYFNDPSPNRVLRIGYVSGDFDRHSAACAFRALLEEFDRACFEVIAYSNTLGSDDLSLSIRNRVTVWRDIRALSDQAVADLIHKDRIDILVDLSGHTEGNRLLVFARKPAPVQVTAIGYPTGTGMRAMDALFADPVVIPAEEKQFYAEDVRYLPSVVMFSRSPDEFPPVNELPALPAGVISFGSFNRMAKITEETLVLWAQLLQSLPKSALIIKAAQLDDPVVRDRSMAHFANAGIAPRRISILGATPWAEHVQVLNRVDIALDTFPHGGGITTLESIIMGVPVVTLRWPTFAGRASASILTSLGLTDWIAESPNQYVKIAIEKSRNLEELAALRCRLRQIFSTSIFGDPAASVRATENEYRKLWQEWCAERISR